MKKIFAFFLIVIFCQKAKCDDVALSAAAGFLEGFNSVYVPHQNANYQHQKNIELLEYQYKLEDKSRNDRQLAYSSWFAEGEDLSKKKIQYAMIEVENIKPDECFVFGRKEFSFWQDIQYLFSKVFRLNDKQMDFLLKNIDQNKEVLIKYSGNKAIVELAQEKIK